MNGERIWCLYCKEEILGDFIVSDNDKYHVECHEQLHLYNDPYGDEEDWWVNE